MKKLAEVIYEITFRFCKRFLARGDRTIDQMVQAARSGKQNMRVRPIGSTRVLAGRGSGWRTGCRWAGDPP